MRYPKSSSPRFALLLALAGLVSFAAAVQAQARDVILATTHVHLDHDLCAEVVLCRGPATRLKAIADGLRQHKGVLHAALSMSSTGRELR